MYSSHNNQSSVANIVPKTSTATISNKKTKISRSLRKQRHVYFCILKLISGLISSFVPMAGKPSVQFSILEIVFSVVAILFTLGLLGNLLLGFYFWCFLVAFGCRFVSHLCSSHAATGLIFYVPFGGIGFSEVGGKFSKIKDECCDAFAERYDEFTKHDSSLSIITIVRQKLPRLYFCLFLFA